MTGLQPVMWSEGLLMSPQHLQQSDRYHESRLDARLGAVEPLSWGVLHVEFDRRSLAQGEVRVAAFVGILPGGTPLALGRSSGALPLARALEGHFPHSESSTDLLLAIPRERSDACNFAETEDGRARYLIARRSVRDLTSDGSEVPVAFGRWNVVLRFGTESNEHFECLKIAELVRDTSGNVQLSDTFIPSCLRLGASPNLLTGLGCLLDALAERRRLLHNARREHGAAAATFQDADITRFLLLNSINAFLPLVQHMIAAQDMHPRACYLLLCQLVGQLATFAIDDDAILVPPFVYSDLRRTFTPLLAKIEALLQATVRDRYVSVALERRNDGIHFGRIPERTFAEASRVCLSVQRALSEVEAAAQLPRLAKIASWQDIHTVVAAATPGVPLIAIYQPPPQVPLKAHRAYFELSIASDYWRRVLDEGALAVYLPHPIATEETTVEIFAVVDAEPLPCL